MDGFYSAIGKRGRRENEVPENNDGNKRSNFDTGRDRALPGTNSTLYRILCPANVVGSVIGKAGIDDCVIVIFSSPLGNDKENKCSQNENENENKVEVEPVCAAHDALRRVHSVIVQQSSSGRDNDADDKKGQHNALLPSANSQIGVLIRKGGDNIRKLRSECGAQIQIRSKDELPGCAFSFGEVVVISGDVTVVKKALYAVSTFLYKHPPKEQIRWSDNLSATNTTSLLPSGPPILGTYASSYVPALRGYGSEAQSSWPLSYNPTLLAIAPKYGKSTAEKSGEEFRIPIVCPNDKIGGVIGKGGNIIKSMRKDTGASIKVEEADSDSDKCVIIVSSTELANDGVSPTLEALLQLQGKAAGRTSDKDEGGICTRLLVPSKHIRCLLGKGCNIVSEMRKHTGANIRIFRKEER
eukprot:PITA_34785